MDDAFRLGRSGADSDADGDDNARPSPSAKKASPRDEQPRRQTTRGGRGDGRPTRGLHS